MGFRAALLRGLGGGGFAGAVLRGLEPVFVPPAAAVGASPLSVRCRDFLGGHTECRGYMTTDQGDTFGATESGIQGWLVALDGVTAAVLESCVHHIRVPLPDGLKTTAIAGTRYSAILALVFANDQDTADYRFNIPAFNPALVSAGGPDMSEGATIDVLTDQMETPLPGTTGGHFTTLNGGTLTATLRGRLAVHTKRPTF